MIQESRLQPQYYTGWPVNIVSTLLCCSFLLHSIILSESQPFSARSVSYILLVFPIESHLIEKQPLLKINLYIFFTNLIFMYFFFFLIPKWELLARKKSFFFETWKSFWHNRFLQNQIRIISSSFRIRSSLVI